MTMDTQQSQEVSTLETRILKLLVDLLESDGPGPDEEQAILTLVRWLKRPTKTPRETAQQATPA